MRSDDHIEKIHRLSQELEELRRRLQNAEQERSELKEAIAELSRTREKFNALINESIYAYAEFDLEGYFTTANRIAEEMSGYTIEEGINFRDLIVEEDHERAFKDLMLVIDEHPNVGPKEYRYRKKNDDEIRHAEVNTFALKQNGDLYGFMCTIRDITAQKRAEAERQELLEQLYHSQKMEAVGALAGGVAHDFNNMLGGILGYSELLKQWAEPGSNAFKAAEAIEKTAERASRLTANLLGFARKGKYQSVPVDMHALIDEVSELLLRTFDRNIVIQKRLEAKTPFVEGDPSQLHQVLMNLAINARDAMNGGGELLFRTRDTVLGEQFCESYPGIDPGPCLAVSCIDNGTGIGEEDLRRIFDPFFTTKEEGKGTGMGLAMVYGIVSNHNGVIEVKSRPGNGSAFNLYFPVLEKADMPPPRKKPVRKSVQRSGTVLMIDDEEVLLDITTLMLKDLGYEVTTSESGMQALEYYSRNWQDIDLVILDMIMPEMDGHECYLAMKRINPEVRAILTTGYGVDERVQAILDLGVKGFIQKPYSMEQIERAVIEVLQDQD